MDLAPAGYGKAPAAGHGPSGPRASGVVACGSRRSTGWMSRWTRRAGHAVPTLPPDASSPIDLVCQLGRLVNFHRLCGKLPEAIKSRKISPEAAMSSAKILSVGLVGVSTTRTASRADGDHPPRPQPSHPTTASSAPPTLTQVGRPSDQDRCSPVAIRRLARLPDLLPNSTVA